MADTAKRKSGKSVADKGATEPIAVSTGKLRDDPIAKQIEKTRKAVQDRPARNALLGLGHEKAEPALDGPDQHILELQRIAELAQSGGLSNEKLTAELQQAIERLTGQKSGKSSAIPLESPNTLKDLEIRGEPAATVKLGKIAPKDELGTSLEQFRKSLDQIKAAVDSSPALQDELRAHPLFNVFSSNPVDDPVAAEIAREVKIRWDDRLLPENKSEPWAQNAATFIEFVYGRWLRAGVLRLKHLRHEPKLYKAYNILIKRDPSFDLGLKSRSYTARRSRKATP